MCPRPKVKPNILDEKWIILGSVQQLEKLMKKNEWEKADKKDIPKMVLTTKGADAKNLAKEYGRLWLSMYKFFCYIGDYRSAILVNRTVCSKTPPPTGSSFRLCVCQLYVQPTRDSSFTPSVGYPNFGSQRNCSVSPWYLEVP
jgi:hypothetical protein